MSLTARNSCPTMASDATSPASSSALDFFTDGPSRRLHKARRHDMDKMEIRTKALYATLHFEAVRFTVYKLQIRSKARNSDAGEWALAKRYSEFFYFRRTLLQLIQRWELQLDDTKKLQSKEFALASNMLLPALEMPSFPRKHMRCDTEAIVAERKQKLQQFVRRMIDAYVDISVFLANTQSEETVAFANLREIFQELENFLDIPEKQKEINRRQTAAVLALQEVEVSSEVHGAHKDRSCCICLDDIDSEDEGEDAGDNTAGGMFEEKLVRLPCSHQFHEDCVIDWFNASTTCPLCRKPAFSEDDVSFDVSIN